MYLPLSLSCMRSGLIRQCTLPVLKRLRWYKKEPLNGIIIICIYGIDTCFWFNIANILRICFIMLLLFCFVRLHGRTHTANARDPSTMKDAILMQRARIRWIITQIIVGSVVLDEKKIHFHRTVYKMQ